MAIVTLKLSWKIPTSIFLNRDQLIDTFSQVWSCMFMQNLSIQRTQDFSIWFSVLGKNGFLFLVYALVVAKTRGRGRGLGRGILSFLFYLFFSIVFVLIFVVQFSCTVIVEWPAICPSFMAQKKKKKKKKKRKTKIIKEPEEALKGDLSETLKTRWGPHFKSRCNVYFVKK